MTHRFALAVLAALAVAGAAAAHDYRIGDIVVAHPYAYETPRSAMTGVGYMQIVNTGAKADRLLALRAEFPRVMLHASEETEGVARMVHVDTVEIPAGATVDFAPGGLHVMFMGLDGDPFEPGEEIPATLVFEVAGEVEVVFTVEARGAAAQDHAPSGAVQGQAPSGAVQGQAPGGTATGDDAGPPQDHGAGHHAAPAHPGGMAPLPGQ